MTRRLLLAAALALLGAGCGLQRTCYVSSGDDAVSPAVARVLSDYEAAWQAKDAPRLAALFAENGYVLPNGSPPVHGRAEIEKHYAGAGGPLALRAIAWGQCGDVGYVIGGYGRERGGEDAGKFTLTLVRAKDGDGRWLILSDMDSPNTRPR